MYKIIHLKSIDSTNKYALREIDTLNHKDVIVAETQTSGRGRLDRDWFSPPGVNLYFSIIIKNFTLNNNNGLLTMIASLAVSNVLKAEGIPAHIKWPNDVLVNKKKICGILAETSKECIIIGIGLNINMDQALLSEISQPATSLKIESSKEFCRETLLNNILDSFFKYYDLSKNSGPEIIIDLWKKALDIINKKINVAKLPKNAAGTVIDIDNDGGLIIENEQGKEKIITGDVNYAD